MLGFNYQESHRVDILRICRHCSCMPSCRRILTSVLKYFWLSIMNVLLLAKYEYAVIIRLCASGFNTGLHTKYWGLQVRQKLVKIPSKWQDFDKLWQSYWRGGVVVLSVPNLTAPSAKLVRTSPIWLICDEFIGQKSRHKLVKLARFWRV